jgi:hypothetical protein
LRFEAKRLGRGVEVSDYLGDEGLGAFLVGHYSTTHQEAGMLGYIQTGSRDSWAGRISGELRANPKRHRTTRDGSWRRLDISSPSPHCFQTEHFDERRRPILIIHVLLEFLKDSG